MKNLGWQETEDRGCEGRGKDRREKEERRERRERERGKTKTHQTLGTRIVVVGMLLVCSSSLPVVYRLISNSPTHSLQFIPMSLQNPSGLSWGVFAENSYNEGSRREGGGSLAAAKFAA